MSDANQVAIAVARAYLSRFLAVYAHRRRLSNGSSFGPSSEEVAARLGLDPLDTGPLLSELGAA